jgi:hemin uptake protein HemP
MNEITLTLPQAMRRATALQQAGNLVESERLCKAVLDAATDHFGALYLLGIIESQRENYNDALCLFDQAFRK